MLCCGAWKATMSKRDYKTSVADGMELEPLGGTGAVDKENSKVNGTQFGEGKCFNVRQQEQQHEKKTDKIVWVVCAMCAQGLSFLNLIWPRVLCALVLRLLPDCVCALCTVQWRNYSLIFNVNASLMLFGDTKPMRLKWAFTMSDELEHTSTRRKSSFRTLPCIRRRRLNCE